LTDLLREQPVRIARRESLLEPLDEEQQSRELLMCRYGADASSSRSCERMLARDDWKTRANAGEIEDALDLTRSIDHPQPIAVLTGCTHTHQQVDPGRVDKAQLRQIHHDQLDTVVPESGLECGLQQRHRREIKLTDRARRASPS
jgi:hypothetical protein